MLSFIKENWVTVAIVGGLAAYMLIGVIGRDCPMCVIGRAVAKPFQKGSGGVVNSVVQPWSAETLDGTTLTSEDLRGKTTVVNFWATWCGPCRSELPELVDLRNRLSTDEVQMVGISVDEPGSVDLAEFAQKKGLNYTIARGDADIVEAFGGFRSIPMTFIVDAEGKIVKTFRGAVKADRILEAIN